MEQAFRVNGRYVLLSKNNKLLLSEVIDCNRVRIRSANSGFYILDSKVEAEEIAHFHNYSFTAIDVTQVLRKRCSMISAAEFDRRMIESITYRNYDERTDHEGQIIIYTGMYEWSDGSIHDAPDPEFGTDDAGCGAV